MSEFFFVSPPSPSLDVFVDLRTTPQKRAPPLLGHISSALWLDIIDYWGPEENQTVNYPTLGATVA